MREYLSEQLQSSESNVRSEQLDCVGDEKLRKTYRRPQLVVIGSAVGSVQGSFRGRFRDMQNGFVFE
jgi:hypothetical protein